MLFSLFFDKYQYMLRHVIVYTISAGLILGAVILLRYPLSIHPTAIPLDPNFPLHALASWDLTEHGTWFTNMHLEWPDGAPVRYLAGTLLGIAYVCNLYLDPIPAFNIATVLWIWMQGFGIFCILQHMTQQKTSHAICGAILCLVSPQGLLALSNGQFENFSPFFLLLTGWSVHHKKYPLTLMALLCCGFSSPYMAILAFLLVIIMEHKNIMVWGNIAITAGAIWWYYHPVTAQMVHESVIPAPSTMGERATPLGLFLPENIAENGGNSWAHPIERWHNIFTSISTETFAETWYWLMPTASNFLGYSWILFGIYGLWTNRHNAFIHKLILWGAICTLISFGHHIDFGFFSIPNVWMLSEFLPGVSNMQATYRFLVGPSIALTLGIVYLYPKHIVWITLGAMVEALFVTPAYWPIPSKYPEIHQDIAHIQEPFIFWPAPPIISSYKVTILSLLLEQPIALYEEQTASMPNPDGSFHKIGKNINRHGLSVQEWLDQVQAQKVNELIQYRLFTIDHKLPFSTHNRKCGEVYCINRLEQILPK